MNKKNIRFINSWSCHKKRKIYSLSKKLTFKCLSCNNDVELIYKMKCIGCGKIICDECAYIDAKTKLIYCPQCW